MDLPPNFTLFDTAADVVIRFRGQDGYKTRANALRALGRRVPDAGLCDCEKAFDFLSAKYDAAAELVAKGLEAEHLDFEECRQVLSADTPPFTWKAIHDILGWAVYYRIR